MFMCRNLRTCVKIVGQPVDSLCDLRTAPASMVAPWHTISSTHTMETSHERELAARICNNHRS